MVSNKIRVFIGSTREALAIARGVKAVLESVAEVRVWDESLFRPGTYTLDELLHFTTDFDFAVFVWSGDDKGTVRNQSFFLPRDNVVLEAGLFYGALGKDRVFLIAPRNPSVKTPTDLLGLSFSYYDEPSDGNYQSAVDTPVRRISALMEQRGKAPRNSLSSIVCHGTKYDVPNRNEFWNDLLRKAERRFYLVGFSNKSWTDKSEEQSIDLSKAIYRIIKNGGKVRILSSNQSEIVDSHYVFFRTHFRACLDVETEISKDEALELIHKNLIYALHPHSNYDAILSDDRLILLPTMNSIRFRDEALVLEVSDAESPQFKNYLGDLDRLFNSKDCELVDVVKIISDDGVATRL